MIRDVLTYKIMLTVSIVTVKGGSMSQSWSTCNLYQNTSDNYRNPGIAFGRI